MKTYTKLYFKSPLMLFFWTILILAEVIVIGAAFGSSEGSFAAVAGVTAFVLFLAGIIWLIGKGQISVDDKGIRNKKNNFTWDQITGFGVYVSNSNGVVRVLPEESHKRMQLTGIRFIFVTTRPGFTPIGFIPHKDGITFQYREDAYDFIKSKVKR